MGRLEGDKFLLILPGISRDEGETIVERVLEHIREYAGASILSFLPVKLLR